MLVQKVVTSDTVCVSDMSVSDMVCVSGFRTPNNLCPTVALHKQQRSDMLQHACNWQLAVERYQIAGLPPTRSAGPDAKHIIIEIVAMAKATQVMCVTPDGSTPRYAEGSTGAH